MTSAKIKRRYSIPQMLSFVVMILLIITVSVTCYMMFVMDPAVQLVNGLRQQSSLTENQLWKLEYLISKASSTNDEQEHLAVCRDISQDLSSLTNNLNSLADTLPSETGNIRMDIIQAAKDWTEMRRTLNELASTNNSAEAKQLMDGSSTEKDIRELLSTVNNTSAYLSTETERTSERSNMISTGVYVIFLVMLLWILTMTRSITGRLQVLRNTSHEIAIGHLSARAEVLGNDEITELAEAFNLMTERIETTIASERESRSKIEKILNTLRTTSESLATSASDILAATTEQAAAMSEESAAVQETSVTVEELKQVTALSAQKAGNVAALAAQSEEVTLCGREAVERSVKGMLNVRDEVQSLALSMQKLSEQTQAVGEIISTVQDLAEQSNMLAVNAAIEAARAGEHGYGFSVVANEVRSLAEQSRQATVQIRSILGEIQKAVGTALNNTEAGTRSVEAGVELVNKAGDVIRSLTDTISHSSSAASQIRASTDQHAAGVEQIAQAITAIRDASVQALENTHQTERQAKALKELSFSLRAILHNNDYQEVS
ncbi:MAG: methyl-accepting chemotaxis protein [bacterium]|nr:methyl-accepting chemotaxis protein [bacterium]